MPTVWTSKRVSSLSVSVVCQTWVRGPTTWVLQSYCDDLEVSYLDADQNVVYGPVQVGSWDGSHYQVAGYTGDSTVLADYEVCGMLLHHRNPGESFPFWFCVDGIQWTDPTSRTWFASTIYPTSELTPTYDVVAAGTYPGLWVPTGFRTSLRRAVFDTSDNQTFISAYPNALSGEALPIDAAWLSSLNASTATSVAGDISPLPDADSNAHFAEIVAAPPLGDLVIMFGEWTDPSRPYLRQRQSPRANPRVSFQRQSLRQRQMIP